MCPGCTVSSPYLRLFVPTLQLPSGLCENTRLFQRHGNKKEMGLVWVSEWLSARLCLCLWEAGTLWSRDIYHSVFHSHLLPSLVFTRISEYVSLPVIVSLVSVHWHLFSLKSFYLQKRTRVNVFIWKTLFFPPSNTLHHDVVCTVETSFPKVFVTAILDFTYSSIV